MIITFPSFTVDVGRIWFHQGTINKIHLVFSLYAMTMARFQSPKPDPSKGWDTNLVLAWSDGCKKYTEPGFCLESIAVGGVVDIFVEQKNEELSRKN